MDSGQSREILFYAHRWIMVTHSKFVDTTELLGGLLDSDQNRSSVLIAKNRGTVLTNSLVASSHSGEAVLLVVSIRICGLRRRSRLARG